MANGEPTNNSQFIYKLNYQKTDWGDFYSGYRDTGQGALQKRLQQVERERAEWKKEWFKPYFRLKIVQHIFYLTAFNEAKEEWETPPILLKHAKHDGDEWFNEQTKLTKISKEVFVAFWKRQEREVKEVKEFYETRQKELAVSQKAHRREHALEEVECPRCGAKVQRTGISRHRKTNRKCLATEV